MRQARIETFGDDWPLDPAEGFPSVEQVGQHKFSGLRSYEDPFTLSLDSQVLTSFKARRTFNMPSADQCDVRSTCRSLAKRSASPAPMEFLKKHPACALLRTEADPMSSLQMPTLVKNLHQRSSWSLYASAQRLERSTFCRHEGANSHRRQKEEDPMDTEVPTPTHRLFHANTPSADHLTVTSFGCSTSKSSADDRELPFDYSRFSSVH